MELLQLKYFCHAAESGNFTRTAEHFRVPTSNISRAIRCLESELGVKLFERSANKIKLNDKGETFYNHSKRALRELDSAKVDLSAGGEPRGEIKLLVSCCRHLATKAIERCVKRFPNVSFSVRHGVDADDYDFLISDLAPQRRSLKKELLMSEKMMLAASKEYASEIKIESGTNLDNERFVSLGSNTRLHALTLQYCNQLGFTPNIAIQTDDPYYVRKFIELGLGVALYPMKSWANLLSENITLIDAGFPKRQTFLFYDKDKHLTAGEEKFIEILKEEFSKA